MTARRDVVVVGAGHNGLVAACYLARAGLDVEVVERDAVIGGAVSTVERWPGVKVDRGSSLHVMVRHAGIVDDLRLGDVGLQYDDIDPWAVAPATDGGMLRFAVDVDATCESIAAHAGARDAEAYAAWFTAWRPRVEAMLDAFARPPSPWQLARAFWPLGRRVGRGGGDLARDFLEPADVMLDRTFADEPLKTALAWWASQAGPAPHDVGTAPLAATAVLMHLRAPGRPRGGSGALSDALAARLATYGGSVRLGDGAVGFVDDGTRVRGVRTASGDTIEAPTVVAACHVLTMLDLLDDARLAADRARVRVGNGIGMVMRLLTDRLPSYRDAPADAAVGMQLLARDRRQLRAAHAEFTAGRSPADPPLLVMTPTSTDPSLAPAGRHVVTAWTQWHPRDLADGDWDDRREQEGDRIIAALDTWSPGFSAAVVERLVQTPLDLERELDLRRGNVMHVEMSLDAMFALRPLPRWSGYRGPRKGLFLCGASTHPGGGVSGMSGRNAADVVLRALRGSLRRRRS